FCYFYSRYRNNQLLLLTVYKPSINSMKMDIATLRTELNDLIENLEKHSAQFPKNRPVPSLEVGVMIAKVHKIQDRLSVLKYLLEKEEVEAKTESYGTFTPPSAMPQQKTTTPESIIA